MTTEGKSGSLRRSSPTTSRTIQSTRLPAAHNASHSRSSLHRNLRIAPQPSMSATPSLTHEPPSLPSSPLPKRTRIIDPTPLDQASALPRGTDSGTATPTPLANMSTPHPTHPIGLQPSAPIAPSIAAAAAAEQSLQVQLLSDKAKAPTKGSAFAAGHDLYSARDVVVPARGRVRVDTDISIAVPAGTCMPTHSLWPLNSPSRV